MKITVTIPGDVTKELAPNRRVHWRVQREASRNAKIGGKIRTRQALEASGKAFTPPVKLTCTRHYSDRARPMDFDNLPVTFKAIIDGVKDALGMDDNSRDMQMEFRQVKATETYLEIEIEQLRDWQEAQAGTVRVIGL